MGRTQLVEEYKAKLEALEAKAVANEKAAEAEFVEKKNTLQTAIDNLTGAAEDSWDDAASKAQAAWQALADRYDDGK